MVQTIPDSFPVATLARGRAAFDATVSLDRVPRYQGLLVEGEATLEVSVQFSVSPMGPAQVVGRLRAGAPLMCQRCLQPMIYQFEQTFRFALVDSERAEKKLPDDMDRLHLDENGRISLSELIEDELILALPQIPWHPEGKCDGQVANLLDGLNRPVQTAETRRPFSGLDALLKDNKPASD